MFCWSHGRAGTCVTRRSPGLRQPERIQHQLHPPFRHIRTPAGRAGMKALSRLMLPVALLAACCLYGAPLLAAEPVEIAVSGVEGDVRKNVEEALALPSGVVREGTVDRLWLERYAHQAEKPVLQALEPFGYYNARATVTLEQADGGRYRLRVQVAPGEPVRLAEVTVNLQGPGAQEETLREQASDFPLAKGSVLLQQRYEQAKGALKSRAQELGYLDADFPVHEIRIVKSASTARIALLMDTGPRYYFDGARIEGASEYPERFLRRYLTFHPGEPFSYAKLGEAQLNFTNSERFREVVVTPERQETRDLRVPVLVRLKPAPPRTLRPGIGYGTDTGARFTIRYRDLNTFDLGHEFSSILYISERLQGLASGYTIPSSRDIRSSTTILLNLQQEDVTAYISRLVSLELARNRSFGKRTVGTAYIRLLHESFTIGAQNSSSRLVLPGVRLTVNGYNNLIRPVEGYRYGFDLRGTDRGAGLDGAADPADCRRKLPGAAPVASFPAPARERWDYLPERSGGRVPPFAPFLCRRRSERAGLLLPVTRPARCHRAGRGGKTAAGGKH